MAAYDNQAIHDAIEEMLWRSRVGKIESKVSMMMMFSGKPKQKKPAAIVKTKPMKQTKNTKAKKTHVKTKSTKQAKNTKAKKAHVETPTKTPKHKK